jgi:F-type H+-transporting ATPase subunit delta
MNADKNVSSRYAEAIFNIAQERNEIDALRADTESLQKLLETAEGQRFTTFLESPVFLTQDKIGMLDKVLKGKVSDTMFNLISMLVRRGRILNLEFVLEQTIDYIDKAQGIFTGTVTTAIELNDDEKSKLLDSLRKRAGDGLQLRYVVQPDILGGTIVRYKDVLIDDSIKSHLLELTNKLKSESIRQEIAAMKG